MWLVLAVLLCQEAQEQEKEVVVIGTRSESDVLDVPSGVSVITREQLERSGASNIVEALQRAPGFFPQGPNKSAVDALADLRGYNNGAGNGQRTLVMVDGRRTNAVTNGATDWASIPLDNVERIEIVRGPAASLYGDPALAGAINIVTRKGKKDETKWRVLVAGGTFDSARGSVEAHGGAGALTYSVFGADEQTDGWRDNSRYEGVDFTGKFEVALDDRWTLHLKLGSHDDDRRRPGTLTQAQLDALGRNATVTPNDKGSRSEVYADAALVHAGKCGEFTVQFSGLRGKAEGFFDFGFGTFDIDDEFEQSGLYLKHVAEIDLLSLKWKLTTGADLVYEEANGVSVGFGTTDADYVRRLAGAYGHVEVRPLPALVAGGSLRFDRALLDVDRDDPFFSFDRTRAFDQWSPAVGATVHVLDELSLYAGYGRPFKYPTRDELNGFSAADPQLEPERSHSYEAGARLWSARWGQASAGYYRMDVKDEIYFDPASFTNLNFDEVRHQGVESEFRLTPCSCVDLFGAYTYTRAVIRSDPLEGKKYPVTPAHMATAGGTVRWEEAFLTLSGRIVGRRFLISDTTNAFDRMASYAVMDAKAGYRWGASRVSLSVFNLFDREYNESGGVTFAGPAYNPAPGRSALLAFEADF